MRVAGQRHGGGGGRDDAMQLLAQQDENDAVGAELDHVPEGVAADAGDGRRRARSLDEVHRQDADQDLRTAFLTHQARHLVLEPA